MHIGEFIFKITAIGNKLPDRCVVDFVKGHNIKTACELGCGEGRNAIYLAKNDVYTEAYDLSEIAIENAKRNAKEGKVEKVVFKAENGYFILVCFAAGEDGADEVDDYEFYRSKHTGVAFTEERLKEFWGERFDIIEL